MSGSPSSLNHANNLQTVQLSKRDTGDKAAQEKWAEQRAAELAAAALAPKDQLIRSLEHNITQLEVTLAQRTEVSPHTRTVHFRWLI